MRNATTSPLRPPRPETPAGVDRAADEHKTRLEHVQRFRRRAIDEPRAKEARELSERLVRNTNEARYRSVKAASEGDATAIGILRDGLWFHPRAGSDAQLQAEARKQLPIYASFAGVPVPATPPAPRRSNTPAARDGWRTAFAARQPRRARKGVAR